MIGFIGAGNMATALIRGMLDGGMDAQELLTFDVNPERMDAMRSIGVATANSAVELANAAETLVLAIKPKDIRAMLATLAEHATVRELVSIAIGWTQAMLEEALPTARGILRMMPNTPALVREGVIALCADHTVSPERFAEIERAFSYCGRSLLVPETLFDAVASLSGSGPAYVYLFIEALGDAGVREGLPRETAYTLAAQTLLGAAKMVLQTGKHPGALKDAVCSPGGSTIEAIYALEKGGLRGAVIDAVDACTRKAAAMAKK